MQKTIHSTYRIGNVYSNYFAVKKTSEDIVHSYHEAFLREVSISYLYLKLMGPWEKLVSHPKHIVIYYYTRNGQGKYLSGKIKFSDNCG